MLALRNDCKVFLGFALFSLFTHLSAFSQTSLDDVHVATRQASASLTRSTATSLQGSGIHVIHADSRLVLVPVSVTDPMQRFVTGLNRDNFEVYEGTKPQRIQTFSSEDVPVSLGIILDVSGSMNDKMPRVREAVNQFCEASNPQDEFFLVTFSDEPRLVVDFTSNPEDLKKELVFTQPKGRTSLLDAIYLGLRKMKNARYGKRALLVISDGGDNHSRYGEREIKGLAKESDVMIYSIGVFDRYVPTPEELRGPSLLTDVAEPTGGRAFTVDNPNLMPPIARHIGLELRTQYVLAYRPQETPHKSTWRKIRVKLRLPRKFPFLQAHAKTGYYASADPEPVTSTARDQTTSR
jgi:Ca-activated chloride channel homolog